MISIEQIVFLWKTSLGLTKSFILKEKVFQGDGFGNILASNQIDKFAKRCLENKEHIYMYRDTVPIAPLRMCDDLLTVSECGFQTDLMASYIYAQARFNFPQFGLSKCYKMHIGKSKQSFECTPVFLDSWKSEEIENKITGNIELQEKYVGQPQIKEVLIEKYLCNQIGSDGTNTADITAKCNRGIEEVDKIQSILESMFCGKYYFEVGKTMIDSMLLSSILNNSEVAYNLTKTDIENLQKCHEMGLKNCFHFPARGQNTCCTFSQDQCLSSF